MMIIGIVGGILLLLIVFFISVFNELTKERVLVQEAWSGIGAFLQQRLDAIPNLVEIVKGYAGHENKTLTDVIRARNESISALTPEAQVEAAKNLSAAMLNFKALAENYPDLKANQNFIRLQEQLADLEEKINQNRRYYNGTVREYNQSIAVFPKNIVAGMFGFKPSFFFIEDTEAAKAPKISF
ncbi:MAG TPA: LemA family protein [Bacteroidia bacterium]|jgi:LemA protein|nr:LemA family protein [Bacteroidia bacterium]HMU20151.1 LemA family protein [Bacteroidia bacterium]